MGMDVDFSVMRQVLKDLTQVEDELWAAKTGVTADALVAPGMDVRSSTMTDTIKKQLQKNDEFVKQLTTLIKDMKASYRQQIADLEATEQANRVQ